MMLLDQSSRQLLVMAALAAVNHGLIDEAQTLLEAFPWLISAEEPRRVCQALMLLGLAQPKQALACLTDLPGTSGTDIAQPNHYISFTGYRAAVQHEQYTPCHASWLTYGLTKKEQANHDGYQYRRQFNCSPHCRFWQQWSSA